MYIGTEGNGPTPWVGAIMLLSSLSWREFFVLD